METISQSAVGSRQSAVASYQSGTDRDNRQQVVSNHSTADC